MRQGLVGLGALALAGCGGGAGGEQNASTTFKLQVQTALMTELTDPAPVFLDDYYEGRIRMACGLVRSRVSPNGNAVRVRRWFYDNGNAVWQKEIDSPGYSDLERDAFQHMWQVCQRARTEGVVPSAAHNMALVPIGQINMQEEQEAWRVRSAEANRQMEEATRAMNAAQREADRAMNEANETLRRMSR